MWIKSDRPGLTLAARIVLPRTIDPRTGRALTTVLLGSGYSDVGRWQQLRVEGIPRLLNWQIRVLLRPAWTASGRPRGVPRRRAAERLRRSRRDERLDRRPRRGRGGRRGGRRPRRRRRPASWTGDNGGRSPADDGIVRLPPVGPNGPAVPAGPKRSVKLVGSVLLVDGRPMFPRVIRASWRTAGAVETDGLQHGLARRGRRRRNCWRRPTAWDCGLSARRRGRLPPTFPTLVRRNRDRAIRGRRPLPRWAKLARSSIASWLGTSAAILTEPDLEATQRGPRQVRAADRRGNRPLICRPRTDLRGFSRAANLLLIDRRPLGTSLELSDYASWVRRQPLLASPGTPVWTTVQTQPNDVASPAACPLGPRPAARRWPSRRNRSGCWPIRPWRREAAGWCSLPTRRWIGPTRKRGSGR